MTTTGSLAGTLGLFQPFRYRGYVYDWETGFYYLQSRYYDPTTGRFISADVLLSTGQGVLGYNCYAYCLGNPVRFYDSIGMIAKCTWNSESDSEGFDDLKELLTELGNKLNRYTSNNNLEYGSFIYMLNEKYYYSKIIKGGHAETTFKLKEAHLPKGAAIIGTMHSHPLCTRHKHDVFSREDINNADLDGIMIYLASPNGTLYFYDPNGEKKQDIVGDIKLIEDLTMVDCSRLCYGGKHINPYFVECKH